MQTDVEGGAPIGDGGAGTGGKDGLDNHVSYENHQRLLKQKKKADERLRELEAREKELLLEKQKAEGKKDEVITTLEQEVEELKGNNRKFLKNMTEKTLKTEITKAALAKGIRPDRVEKFLKLTEDSFFKESDIQVDEDFNIVNRDAFESVLEKEVKDNADWFTKAVAGPSDVTPSGSHLNAPQKKLDDMSVDELAEML